MKRVLDEVVLPYLVKNTTTPEQFSLSLANFSEKLLNNEHTKMETLEAAIVDDALIDKSKQILLNNPDLSKELRKLY